MSNIRKIVLLEFHLKLVFHELQMNLFSYVYISFSLSNVWLNGYYMYLFWLYTCKLNSPVKEMPKGSALNQGPKIHCNTIFKHTFVALGVSLAFSIMLFFRFYLGNFISAPL